MISLLAALPLVLHTSGEIRAYAAEGDGEGFARIAHTGVVQQVSSNAETMIVEDAEGRCRYNVFENARSVRPGDRIAISGHVILNTRGTAFVTADFVKSLGKADVTATRFVRLPDLDERRDDLADVETEGVVLRAFIDDVDENYIFLLLKEEGATLPVALPRTAFATADGLLDARLSVRGTYNRIADGSRRCSGPFVLVSRADDVRVLKTPPEDPFAVPPLNANATLTPQEIARLGRRSVSGEVLATWGGDRAMVRDERGNVVNVELRDGERLPACGECGVFAGTPETDFFRINLSNARFRPTGRAPASREKPQDIAPADVFTPNGYIYIDATHSGWPANHGRLFRLTGVVRGTPSERNGETRMILDCAGHKVFVDLSANPTAADGIPLDSTVAVTGRCLLETDNWRADNAFPRIRGFSLVPRSSDDLVVLKRPSWWTPHRLLAVIGLLAAALLAVLLWILALRRLVERRSRELYRTRHVRDLAELRTAERTRLAVELHDSISQNISGASMRVDAAQDFIDRNPDRAHQCLAVASKTLVSCREELRNCIWDLRNNTLDETSVAEAIRVTVQPHLSKASLCLRFNVPRAKISDNTLHALLHIVRELVSNAVRHGHATALSIAGTVDGDKLLFRRRQAHALAGYCRHPQLGTAPNAPISSAQILHAASLAELAKDSALDHRPDHEFNCRGTDVRQNLADVGLGKRRQRVQNRRFDARGLRHPT